MKLQLTSFLGAVKLGHPGYQLNYTGPLETGKVSSCTSIDVKLVKCGRMDGREKKERVVSPASSGGKKGRESVEKGSLVRLWRDERRKHIDEELKTKSCCCRCCRSSCLKASTRTDGENNAALKVLRISHRSAAKFMDDTARETGKPA